MPVNPLETRGEKIPGIDWDALPAFDAQGFVSRHANPVDLMLGDLASAQSRRTYESRLIGVARLLAEPVDVRSVPWQSLRYEHVVALKKALRDREKSTASINATLSAIRKITRTCVLIKQMARDDMLAIHAVTLDKASRSPAGREVKVGELEAMVRACQEDRNKAAGMRDMAVIGFLTICGLRRIEVSSICREQLDLDAQSLRVVGKGKGKGNKERWAYPDPGTLAAVRQWLDYRHDFPGWLFLPVNKSGRVLFDQGGISDQAIYNIIKKRQREAGVRSCAPHDFRRTFGSELLRQGVDLLTVQRLMGHADPSTTARYDRRDPDEDRSATRGLHLPFET